MIVHVRVHARARERLCKLTARTTVSDRSLCASNKAPGVRHELDPSAKQANTGQSVHGRMGAGVGEGDGEESIDSVNGLLLIVQRKREMCVVGAVVLGVGWWLGGGGDRRYRGGEGGGGSGRR